MLKKGFEAQAADSSPFSSRAELNEQKPPTKFPYDTINLTV
jgi:hypothetical protein